MRKPLTTSHFALHCICLSWLLLAQCGEASAQVPQSAAPKNTPPATPLPAAPLPANEAASISAPPEFMAFDNWAQKYIDTPAPAARMLLLADGEALAKTRRTALSILISADPKQAIELAVPMRVRQLMPASILALLEERISTRGEYAVLIATKVDAQTGERQAHLSRMVNISGRAYRASVYGRRLGTTSKTQMAFHGIAIDNVLAVHESPIRLLELGERLPIDVPLGREGKRCPICRVDATNGIVADVGGVFYFFDSDKDIQTFRARIEAQEDILGPEANGLEKPMSEKPMSEKPMSEKPMSEKPMSEKPMETNAVR